MLSVAEKCEVNLFFEPVLASLGKGIEIVMYNSRSFPGVMKMAESKMGDDPYLKS